MIILVQKENELDQTLTFQDIFQKLLNTSTRNNV